MISVKQRNTQVDRCGHDERWGASRINLQYTERNTQVDRCGHDERWGASEDKHRGRFRTVEWIQKRRTNRKTGREEPEGIRN